jgi:hypothetical protein
MNASLAQLILSRIQAHGLPWLDKTAGLTRAISFKSKGVPAKSYTWPIACDVSDPQGCDVSTQSELMPDERLTSLLFFEGETFPQRIADRALGIRYNSRLRIVVWMNCSKLGGSCNCGDHAARDLIAAIESRVRYSEGPFIGVRHKIIGGAPSTGPAIFSKYTFDEARSQYLHYPFDFFALDIETDFRILPGCEDQLDPDNVNCWQPPTGPPRKWPKDLTCAELTDPVNGLTAEQLGPDCLDCAGTTVCDLCTEIAKESSTPQDIVDCIDDAGKTAGVQALLCETPECEPLTATLNGVEIINEAEPCGKELALECDDLVDAVVVEGAGTEEVNGLYRRDGEMFGMPLYRKDNGYTIDSANPSPDTFWQISSDLPEILYTSEVAAERPWLTTEYITNDGVSPAPTVRQATIADLCPCEGGDATPTWDGEPWLSIPAGTSPDINCDTPVPAAYVQDGGSKTGTYKPDGTVNGKTRYRLDANHTLEYSGTRWECVHPGPDDQAALGNEDAPWDADWSGTSLTVTQATIGSYCDDCEPCEDVTIQLQDTAANDIGAPDVYPAGTSTTKTAPDGTVTIRNSVLTTLHTVNVKSNGTETQDIADSTITRPDGTTVGLPATVALDVRNYRSGIVYQFGDILHTGQTSVYRTGDEGTMFANGFFNRTMPVYPEAFALLASPGVLVNNNKFGNTIRFTDTSGGAAATSGDRIIVDNLTGIEYYILNSLPAAASWDAAIDAALASTADGGGWVLAPEKVVELVTNYQLGTGALNYAPFNINVQIWTGTTNPANTTQARFYNSSTGVVANQAKSNSTISYIFCRKTS